MTTKILLLAGLAVISLSAAARAATPDPNAVTRDLTYAELDPHVVSFLINEHGFRANSVSILIEGKEVSRFLVTPDWRNGNDVPYDSDANELVGRLNRGLFEARTHGRKFILNRSLIGNYGTVQGNRVTIVGNAVVVGGTDAQGRVLRDPASFNFETASSLIRGCGKIGISVGDVKLAQIRPERPSGASIPCVSREADAVTSELVRRANQAKAEGRPIAFDYTALDHRIIDQVLSSQQILNAFQIARNEDFEELRLLPAESVAEGGAKAVKANASASTQPPAAPPAAVPLN